MYSDPAALQHFAELAGLSEDVVKRSRDEFFPKEVLLPEKIVGLKQVMRDAVALDYIHKQLSRKQIAELVQIIMPEPGGARSIFSWLRD